MKTSQLMLYSETIAVCSQIHTKHINTLCGQNVEFCNFISCARRKNHWASLSVFNLVNDMKYYNGGCADVSWLGACLTGSYFNISSKCNRSCSRGGFGWMTFWGLNLVWRVLTDITWTRSGILLEWWCHGGHVLL
jgi:hypothetical protein